MNNYKQCETLISDILDLKLGVGDIVEFKYLHLKKVEKWKVLYQPKGSLLVRFLNIIDEYVVIQRVPKDLKLKQCNITLLMVLEAMNGSAGDFGKEMNEWTETDIHNCLIHWRVKLLELWQLRKDNRDLSLFDQKNEVFKFIIEVLK